MEHYYRLMVPTTIGNRPAPADLVDRLRREIKLGFAAAFGGYTEYRAVGGYVLESGELVEEPVYAIESSYEEAADELVFQYARRIKTELRQESVMVRKDHEVYFV